MFTVDPPDKWTKAYVDSTPWKFIDYHDKDILAAELPKKQWESGIHGATLLRLGINLFVPRVGVGLHANVFL